MTGLPVARKPETPSERSPGHDPPLRHPRAHSRRRTGRATRPVPVSEGSWAVRCAAACGQSQPGGVPPLSTAGSGSHPHPPGGRDARPAWRVARPVRRRMHLRRSRRPGRADRPAARELTEFGHRGVLLVLGQLAPSGMVPCGPGELGDEDTVGARSGTMILIHLDRIEHDYDKSKVASSSPRSGHGPQQPIVCQHSEGADDVAFL